MGGTTMEKAVRGVGGAAMLAAALSGALPTRSAAVQAHLDDRCAPPPADASASAALTRAVEAMGAGHGDPLRFRAVERQVQDYQSDRTYPPFFAAYSIQEVVYDPASDVERVEGQFVYPRTGPGRSLTTFVTGDAAFAARGENVVPAPFFAESGGRTRLLNPWAALADWPGRTDVRVVGVCDYRDQGRLVLESEGPFGPERLFLDMDSGFPVKLDRTVPHVTWGQQRVEYLWSTWIEGGPGRWFPSASFRVVDGSVVLERTVGEIGPVARDSVAMPALPDAPPMAPDVWLESFTAQAPDTARISGDVVLLTQPMYNGALVRYGDTVYVMDATLSEARARQDSARVAALFPDARHVTLVVTDLAWPHVGGVRFWVARGATVVSHPSSEAFLRELVEREWTWRPDALEAARDRARLDFVPVPEGGLTLGDGAVRVVPIDGVGGEGAVMAWMPGAGFLWAGDYIQTVTAASLYAGDVIRAARRAGIEPDRVAAQHLPLTDWNVVLDVNGGG